MDNLHDENFWPSYLDLMISLFFVVLLLLAASFIAFKPKADKYEVTKNELNRLEYVKTVISSLMDTSLFSYEETYKRFKIKQKIQFESNEYEIKPNKVKDFDEVESNITQVGNRLKFIVDSLQSLKKIDDSKKDISYVIIITGMASKIGKSEEHNYSLSYQRANALNKFWKEHNIDLESEEYHNIIDFQMAGVGWYGLGRIKSNGDQIIEEQNQCFFIQIIPKIGGYLD